MNCPKRTRSWKLLIYGLTDPRTDEVRYIGRSTSGLVRPYRHLENKRVTESHYPVYCWIRKLKELGLKPAVLVLEDFGECKDWETANALLNEAEMRWIAAKRKEGAHLLNCTDGGGGLLGHKLSDETRTKMRESQFRRFLKRTADPSPDPSAARFSLDIVVPTKRQTRKKKGDQSGARNPFYGKRHSEETRRKISEREVSQVTRDRIRLAKVKRVCCLDDGLVFDSVRLASQHYDISEAAIAACARGLRKSGNAKGRRFRYE